MGAWILVAKRNWAVKSSPPGPTGAGPAPWEYDRRMSRMLKGGCLLALLFLVMPSSALAARDWWVSPTGTGTACSQAVPCSYTYFIPAEPETSGDTVLFRGDLGSY